METTKVTVMTPFNVIGSNGTKYYFVPFTQYDYCITDNDIIVTILEEDFNLTNKDISLEVRDLNEDEQLSPSAREEKRLIDTQVHDNKKETLEIIGLDIKADERTDFNGRWLEKFLYKKDTNTNE